MDASAFEDDRAAISGWLTELRTVKRYSQHTLDAYERDLNRLVEACAPASLKTLSSHDIRRVLASQHKAGAHPRSLSRLLSSWRGFFQWWSRHIRLPANPADGVRPPKAARPLPKALSVEQATALLDNGPAPATGPHAAAIQSRDRAMFELMYSSGLRLSELTGLDLRYVRTPDYESAGWLNADESEVTVLGKGRKRRTVPVGSAAMAAMAAWLQARPQLAQASEPALFVGVRGARVAPRVVQQRLAQWANLAGTPARVHPHVLRHSFASHVLQSAQDLRAVQEMLGHASIATTQIYTRLDFQHLAKAYDQAHPRAGRRKAPTQAPDAAAEPQEGDPGLPRGTGKKA